MIHHVTYWSGRIFLEISSRFVKFNSRMNWRKTDTVSFGCRSKPSFGRTEKRLHDYIKEKGGGSQISSNLTLDLVSMRN